jgi:hypothetical protein
MTQKCMKLLHKETWQELVLQLGLREVENWHRLHLT